MYARTTLGAPVEVEDSDGTTFTNTEEGWWANLRPSNTEPFLRLNLEAPDTPHDGARARRDSGSGAPVVL